MQVASRVLTGEEKKLRMADGGWRMADGRCQMAEEEQADHAIRHHPKSFMISGQFQVSSLKLSLK